MFNRSEVIVFTNKHLNKQTNKQIQLKTSVSLGDNTPVEIGELNNTPITNGFHTFRQAGVHDSFRKRLKTQLFQFSFNKT